jgi:hypothetical protein
MIPNQAARRVLRRLSRARHLSLRHVPAHRAGGARADRGEVRDARGALDPDALLTVREGRPHRSLHVIVIAETGNSALPPRARVATLAATVLHKAARHHITREGVAR